MRRLALAALTLAVPGVEARAQAFGDPLLTATISQSFVADSNYGLDDPRPGASYYADTRLILGLLNETPTQTFELGLDTGLRALWEADQDFDFTFASPSTANVGYAQEWAGAALDTDFRYRQTEIDTADPLDFDDLFDPDTGVPLPPDDIDRSISDVTERRYDASVDLELATDAPNSYEFSLAATRFDYDETSTSRVPRDTFTGDALWRLRLTPVLSAAFGGGYSFYSADNLRETEIRTAEADAGVIYEPNEALRLDVGLGYADRRKEETLDAGEADERRVDDDRSGPVVRGGLRYQFEDVLVVADARWTKASVGSPFTGTLRAVYPLPRGELSGRVFQRKGGASSGSETEVQGAAIGLLHEINTVSALNFDLAASRQQDETAPFEPDITRLDFTATYSRALTEVVAANVGYRYRTFDQDRDDADSNSVFFELARTFTTRP